jgi:uncharacterized membrane protein YdjX (TVP38/TMEM64 family)
VQVPTARKHLGIIIAVLVLISFIAILYPFISNPTSITEAYESAGVFAPILFMLLVMVAPTPGALVGASGGAYFGVWHGALYLFLGNLIGVCVTFLLVKKFGRPAAQRFFKEEKLAEYERFVNRHPYLQWFVYTLPIFPIELMTFVIALSKKTFKQFFITVVLALPIYALFVTNIGKIVSDRYQQAFEYASVAILIIMVYAILHFLYAWKKEQIHRTGRSLHKHMKQGVGDITHATEKLARTMAKPVRKLRRR